jgi:hypothetical protein
MKFDRDRSGEVVNIIKDETMCDKEHEMNFNDNGGRIE